MKVRRRKYLVAYTLKGGTGRIFYTTDAKFPICENLILAFEKNLREVHGIENPAVYNVVPLEEFWEDRPTPSGDPIPVFLACAAASL